MTDISQVLFTVPTDAAEAVAALLTEQGRGVEQRDAETTPALAEDVTELVVWLPSSAVQGRVSAVETLLGALKELGRTVDPWSWSAEEVDPDSWRDAYKRYFKVNHVGRHIVVCPSWESYEGQPGELVMQLDPGMAFGTGLHASTRLVIAAMERVAHNGLAPKRVLDLGCGTGILAIAAAKLWPAARILAVDRDAQAVQICRDNLQRNGLQSRVMVEQRSGLELKASFHLILANLTAEILTELQPKMRRKMENTSYAVLSGITAEQAPDVALLYCQDLQLEPEYSEEAEGWRALLLKARD